MLVVFTKLLKANLDKKIGLGSPRSISTLENMIIIGCFKLKDCIIFLIYEIRYFGINLVHIL